MLDPVSSTSWSSSTLNTSSARVLKANSVRTARTVFARSAHQYVAMRSMSVGPRLGYGSARTETPGASYR